MSECPNCGAPDSKVIPVWEDKDRWDADEQPKFIGCTACHKMMRVDLLRNPDDDETPPQLRLSKHERARLAAKGAVGNQNNHKPTIIEWQCIKGAAAYYGVSDWTAKADATLTKEENVSLMERYATRNGSKTLRETGTQFEYYGDWTPTKGEASE